jgi:hypothetical protein
MSAVKDTDCILDIVILIHDRGNNNPSVYILYS